MRYVVAGTLMLLSTSSQASWFVQPALEVSYSHNLVDNYDSRRQVALDLEAEYQRDAFSFKFDGSYYHDFIYQSESERYSQRDEDVYENRLRVDEGYVGWESETVMWRFGVQTVAWGEADDLRLVDVINPLDFRDSVLFDLDEYRIGVPAIRAEAFLSDDVTLDVITLLGYQSNRFVPQGGELTTPGYVDVDISKDEIIEVGMRLSSFLWGADASLFAFSGHNDTPIPLGMEAFSGANQDEWLKTKRYTMLGTTISSPYKEYLFRGEFAYSMDILEAGSDFSYKSVDKIQSLLGVDYRYIDWNFTFQIAQNYISGYSKNLIAERTENTLTLSAEREYMAGMLTTRAAYSYVDSYNGGSLYQIKMTYRPTSKILLTFNIDVLDGDQGNAYGVLQNQDRLYAAIKYYF